MTRQPEVGRCDADLSVLIQHPFPNAVSGCHPPGDSLLDPSANERLGLYAAIRSRTRL